MQIHESFSSKKYNCSIGMTKKLCIFLGIIAVGVLIFLGVCFGGAYYEQYKSEHRDEYFEDLISTDEQLLVQTAFEKAPVEMEYSSNEHLHLLFYVLWSHYDVDAIDIVSAEVIPFSNEDIQENIGVLLEGYALKVTEASGDEYIVWYAAHLQRIIRNDREELLCRFITN